MALLENENIRLRALEPEDLALLYRWENDPDLWSVGTTLAPYSKYLLKEYIAESHRDIFDLKQLRMIIELIATKEAIGIIDLFDFDPHSRRAGTGVMVSSGFQKKGYGMQALELLCGYAFSFLKLHQLYAHIPVNNQSSKKLFGRCGFEITGTLTDWISTENGYMDVWIVQKINEKFSY